MVEAQERFALIKRGPRQETVHQARARLEQAKQTLALAETQLGYATLVSPLAGVVLSKNVEPGEYVAAGTPVVAVGDLEHVWLRAYINETDLGRVKIGQRVDVTTDTYPGKVYEGCVSFLASQSEFTPKNVQTEKERVKLVYRVKVDIPNPTMELKPGMVENEEVSMTTQRPHPETERPMDASLLTFDIPALLAQIKREETWQKGTRNGMTLLKGQDRDPPSRRAVAASRGVRVLLGIAESSIAVQERSKDHEMEGHSHLAHGVGNPLRHWASHA